MPCLIFSPTFNSLTVSWSSSDAASRVSRRKRDVGRCSDPLLRALGPHLFDSVVSCPLDMTHGPYRLTLHPCGPPSRPLSDSDDDSSGSDDLQKSKGKELSGSQELQPSAESRVFFGFLEAGRPYAVIVSAEGCREKVDDPATSGSSPHEGDLVSIAGSSVGSVTGMSHNFFGPLLRVSVLDKGGTREEEVKPSSVTPISQSAKFAFNFQTLPAFPGLPPRISRSLLLPIDNLGPWLLHLQGNYAYATSLDPCFLIALFEHGLFVLPGDGRQIFSCPFPARPYVFRLQELPRSSWRGKMLRRYGKEFEMSCNCDFQGHLRRCGQYHEAKGGTWISQDLISALVDIHRDPSNKVRMYCFELWDKATGELAAASFGLRIGAFFHDFSMCCLVKDRRSAGSILTKAIGALLTDCGVQDWYWGCKMEYMAEYESHGAKEITRQEYYTRLRSSIHEELSMDPCDAISAGDCLIQGRACGSV